MDRQCCTIFMHLIRNAMAVKYPCCGQRAQQFIISKYFQMQNEPVQRCDNCLKDFPQSKMATHFGYCRRNIKQCQACGEMFDINFKQQHEEEFHRKEKCPHCAKDFPQADYKSHEKRCEHKPKFCEYCELNVPVSSFPSHFAACQSRTKPCTKCNRPIMNKDYLIHLVSCEGVVAQPKKPASYMQHIEQYQKRPEQQYTRGQIDRVSSREKPMGVKPREQNRYAEITSKREEVKTYQPRIINPPRQQLSKKQYINYPPQQKPQVKRQQVQAPKRYTGSINFANNNVAKKQDSKSIGIKPATFNNQPPKKPNNGSRQAPRAPASNKEIFPQNYSVKDSKSSDKNGFVKKEQEYRPKYGIPTYSKPQQVKKPAILENRYPRAPQVPVTVIPKPKQQISRKKSPQARQQEFINHSDLGEFGLSPEEQMMQEILMQSANEQRGANKPQKVSGKTKNDIGLGLIEGEDFMMNQSFIEKQKAIEEELARNRRKR